eukprot:140003-Pyramimonas_sp.AAC.1
MTEDGGFNALTLACTTHMLLLCVALGPVQVQAGLFNQLESPGPLALWRFKRIQDVQTGGGGKEEEQQQRQQWHQQQKQEREEK